MPTDWDHRYRSATDGALFGDDPVDTLLAAARLPGWPPQTALMLADGDGRNGTWLAKEGSATVAVDVSAEAARLAQARDAGAGVTVERIVADLRAWSPEARRFEAACAFYLQGPADLRRHTITLACAALSPGGWLLVEGFSTAQAALALGPDDPDKLYCLDTLLSWCAGLETVLAETERLHLASGTRHRGEAEIVRLIARRRA